MRLRNKTNKSKACEVRFLTLVIALFIFAQIPIISSAYAGINSISGTIYLPDGDLAPEDGILVYIGYKRTDQSYQGDVFEIEAEKNSVEYTLTLYDNADLNDLKVRSTIPGRANDGTPYKKTPYSDTTVYYSSSGTVIKPELAEPVKMVNGTASGINLTLARSYIVSGTISLPNDDLAPEDGILVYVGFKLVDQNYMGETFKIEAGMNAVQYVLSVYGEADLDDLKIRSGIPNYVSGGIPYKKTPYSDITVYYSSKGTVLNSDFAEPVKLVGGSVSNINITLMKNTQYLKPTPTPYPVLQADLSGASSWAVQEIQKAVSYGIMTEKVLSQYTNNITREEFCELAVKLYEGITGIKAPSASINPFNDTNNSEILKAYKLGIVSGKAIDKFMPSDPVTRQEICVMICRTLRKAVPGLDTIDINYNTFNDSNNIASWAISDVMFCNASGIMNGVGDNRIDPTGYTTREQAIAFMVRTYEKYFVEKK